MYIASFVYVVNATKGFNCVVDRFPLHICACCVGVVAQMTMSVSSTMSAKATVSPSLCTTPKALSRGTCTRLTGTSDAPQERETWGQAIRMNVSTSVQTHKSRTLENLPYLGVVNDHNPISWWEEKPVVEVVRWWSRSAYVP
jgi:hypothetical protein